MFEGAKIPYVLIARFWRTLELFSLRIRSVIFRIVGVVDNNEVADWKVFHLKFVSYHQRSCE